MRRQPNCMFTYRGVNTCLAWCLDSVLNVKAAFNQETALEGAFSVIVQLRRLIVAALVCFHTAPPRPGMTELYCGGYKHIRVVY